MANRYLKTGEFSQCRVCEKQMYLMPYEIKLGRKKYCSVQCLRKGDSYTNTFELGHKDFVPKESRGHTQETKDKISKGSKGKHSGALAWNWIEDRTKVKVGERSLNDPLQKQWRKSVKDRDNWSCRIADNNCNGKLEAHHILRWSKFPELRNEVNNGITLCHFHHPRKIKDEMRLIPIFKELVIEK